MVATSLETTSKQQLSRRGTVFIGSTSILFGYHSFSQLSLFAIQFTTIQFLFKTLSKFHPSYSAHSTVTEQSKHYRGYLLYQKARKNMTFQQDNVNIQFLRILQFHNSYSTDILTCEIQLYQSSLTSRYIPFLDQYCRFNKLFSIREFKLGLKKASTLDCVETCYVFPS